MTDKNGRDLRYISSIEAQQPDTIQPRLLLEMAVGTPIASPSSSFAHASQAPESFIKGLPRLPLGLVQFIVEAACLEIPNTRFLTESKTFATKYGLTADSDGPARVIELDARLGDFESFLKVLLAGDGYYKSQPNEQGVDEWLSTLKLASMWQFDSLRDKAISQLIGLPMDPMRRIRVARMYASASLLAQGYSDIIETTGPRGDNREYLTMEVLEELGLEVSVRLINIIVARNQWSALTKKGAGREGDGCSSKASLKDNLLTMAQKHIAALVAKKAADAKNDSKENTFANSGPRKDLTIYGPESRERDDSGKVESVDFRGRRREKGEEESTRTRNSSSVPLLCVPKPKKRTTYDETVKSVPCLHLSQDTTGEDGIGQNNSDALQLKTPG